MVSSADADSNRMIGMMLRRIPELSPIASLLISPHLLVIMVSWNNTQPVSSRNSQSCPFRRNAWKLVVSISLSNMITTSYKSLTFIPSSNTVSYDIPEVFCISVND